MPGGRPYYESKLLRRRAETLPNRNAHDALPAEEKRQRPSKEEDVRRRTEPHGRSRASCDVWIDPFRVGRGENMRRKGPRVQHPEPREGEETEVEEPVREATSGVAGDGSDVVDCVDVSVVRHDGSASVRRDVRSSDASFGGCGEKRSFARETKDANRGNHSTNKSLQRYPRTVAVVKKKRKDKFYPTTVALTRRCRSDKETLSKFPRQSPSPSECVRTGRSTYRQR